MFFQTFHAFSKMIYVQIGKYLFTSSSTTAFDEYFFQLSSEPRFSVPKFENEFGNRKTSYGARSGEMG